MPDLQDLERLVEKIPAVVFVSERGKPVHVDGACLELLGEPGERFVREPWRWEEARSGLHAITSTSGERTYGVLVEGDPSRDEVTHLPGRPLLLEHLRLATARARASDDHVVLLHVGLDGLDLVTAGLGHAARDEALREVAGRVKEALSDTALVASSGDGQLAIMLADVEGAAEQLVETAAGAVIVAAGRPLSIEGEEFELRPRIGASVHPGDAADAEALLRHAEAAMREVRRTDGLHVLFYDGGTSEALERLLITSRLRRALDQDELVLHYQPMFRLSDGGISAVEALVRWQDPDRGLIPPLDFIPAAEYTGLIEPIGRWVFEECCRQAAGWRDAGMHVPISFNVSPRQFRDSSFVESLRTTLAQHDLDPELFMVEITESVAMREPVCVEPILEDLKRLGVRLAIDDFGTGHSSLARLRDLDVDVLKIDRGFLHRAPEDERATRLLRATLDLAAALGMEPVVEGVETEQQRNYLAEGGCAHAQGFHLARPLTASAVTELLEQEQR